MRKIKGIYLYKNKINNKIYIGQSTQLEERHKQHKRNSININDHEYNNAFHIAIRKYGFDNFDYQILEQNKDFTKEELNELEQYYIKKYDSYNNGYNETWGGQSGAHFAKLSEKEVHFFIVLFTVFFIIKKIGHFIHFYNLFNIYLIFI